MGKPQKPHGLPMPPQSFTAFSGARRAPRSRHRSFFCAFTMIFSDFIYLAVGLVMLVGLIGGSEKVVDHCVALMKQKGVSGGVLGLTVISIGTSLPEILTHIIASANIVTGQLTMDVASATVLGTNIGSDIVQQNLLVGVVALAGALRVSKRFLLRDMSALIGAAAMVWLLGLDGGLSRPEGAALVVAYGMYLAMVYFQRDQQTADDVEAAEADEELTRAAPAIHWTWIIGGLLVVVTCGHFALEAVDHFVQRFGLGGSLLGVAVIGVATALPELSTAIASVRRGQAGLSAGTLVGSNITNPLLAIGLGAVISTYTVPRVVIVYDLPVKVATAVMILLFFLRGRRLFRYQAILLIACYFAYLIVRFVLFPKDVF